MARHLPHSEEAILDIRKIEDYCLSPSHPRGRHKARVFRQSLDLRQSDAAWLRHVVLEAARSGEASQVSTDDWGTHCSSSSVTTRVRPTQSRPVQEWTS